MGRKTILLTGATGGLGREFARQLLQKGALLILTDVDAEELTRTARAIAASDSSAPGEILGWFSSNLTTREGCEAVFQESLKLSPVVDLLLNNAGITAYGDFHETSRDKWENVLKLNLMAPMYLTHLFLPGMIERKAGQIVNVCSIAGITGTTQSTAYAASKFGLRGFGMSLQKETKRNGVEVSTIYPLWMKTKLLETPPEGNAQIKKLPSLFTYSPEEVAAAAIKEIERGKAHIFPGLLAKLIGNAARFNFIVGSQRR